MPIAAIDKVNISTNHTTFLTMFIIIDGGCGEPRRPHTPQTPSGHAPAGRVPSAAGGTPRERPQVARKVRRAPPRARLRGRRPRPRTVRLLRPRSAGLSFCGGPPPAPAAGRLPGATPGGPGVRTSGTGEPSSRHRRGRARGLRARLPARRNRTLSYSIRSLPVFWFRCATCYTP